MNAKTRPATWYHIESCTIVAASPRALHIKMPSGNHYWVPSSQCRNINYGVPDEEQYSASLSVAEWLAKKKSYFP